MYMCSCTVNCWAVRLYVHEHEYVRDTKTAPLQLQRSQFCRAAWGLGAPASSIKKGRGNYIIDHGNRAQISAGQGAAPKLLSIVNCQPRAAQLIFVLCIIVRDHNIAVSCKTAGTDGQLRKEYWWCIPVCAQQEYCKTLPVVAAQTTFITLALAFLFRYARCTTNNTCVHAIAYWARVLSIFTGTSTSLVLNIGNVNGGL